MQTVDDQNVQQQHTTGFRLEVKERSDKLMNYFLPCFFAAGLWLAHYYDTWVVAFGIGGLSLIAYYSAKISLPNSNLYQYVLSVVLGIFMAQYIYQMHGLFEMHFIAFIGSALLITYQNWKLQIPLAAFVVVHHAVFGYLQNSGFDNVYFTQLDYFALRTFIIHVLLAAVIFFVSGLWAYQLNKYNELQINQAMEMALLQQEAMMAASLKKQHAERVRTQRELAESNNRFIYASQATSDAIWDRKYTDKDVFWGDGFKTLFGYDINKETQSILFWSSKVHPDDLPGVTAIIQAAKNDPAVSTWHCEYRFLKADGEYAFVKEKAVILRDDKGRPARTIGALQDITENKRQEIVLKQLNEELEKEKYFLDSLMDNMPDSIYFKDRDSRFIRVSKYMADRFRSTTGDLIGRSDVDIQDETHARQAFEDEQEIQRTGVPKIDYIEKEVKEDGIEHWVTTTKMPLINARGEIVGTFGMSRDITNIKRLEEERHTAELDKAVAQGKFEIASDVMHDIGNAMVGFGAYLTRIRRLQEQARPENLQNLAQFFSEQHSILSSAIGDAKAGAVVKMLEGIAETQKNNQEEMNKTITEQLNIITHIQEILNIQRQYINGQESRERKPVNLRALINDSLSMLLGPLDKTGTHVSLNIPTELPIVRGDRTKLMQVFLNLLKNSIEAMDVDAAEKNISIEVSACNDKLMLQIRDNGKGFDKTTASKLFIRGFTTKSSGSGLGLYNCKSIIESHDGAIDITSEGNGKGTITTISLRA